jgi:hypothetical protein
MQGQFLIGLTEIPRGVLGVDTACAINGKVHLQYAVAADSLTHQANK